MPSGGAAVVGPLVGSGLSVGSGEGAGSGLGEGSGFGAGLGTGTGTTVTMGTTTTAPSESVEVDDDTVEVVIEAWVVSAVVSGGLVVPWDESMPELAVVMSLAVVASVVVVVSAESLVVVTAPSLPESDVVEPVTEAVMVEAVVVIEMVPAPGVAAAQAGISIQKGPPQVKDWTPQQSSGTTNVSPTARSLMPGFAADKQVASRKVSIAT